MISLENEFQAAYRDGDVALLKWSETVWDHADAGRKLLKEVEAWDGHLPDDHRSVKLLWKHFSNLHYILVRGIAMIEARVEALNPGIFVASMPDERERIYCP